MKKNLLLSVSIHLQSKRMEGNRNNAPYTLQESTSFHGNFNSFDNVTILPRPKQRPLPIWVTANPNDAYPRLKESALKRVARLGDGWMTTANTVESLKSNLKDVERYAEEEGRPLPKNFETCLYYNIHVNENRRNGLKSTKQYLKEYYGVEYDDDFLERWVAIGSPRRCIRDSQICLRVLPQLH